MLNGFYSARNHPEHLPRIRFKDPASGKALVFLTNNTSLPVLTITALYRSHWPDRVILVVENLTNGFMLTKEAVENLDKISQERRSVVAAEVHYDRL